MILIEQIDISQYLTHLLFCIVSTSFWVVTSFNLFIACFMFPADGINFTKACYNLFAVYFTFTRGGCNFTKLRFNFLGALYNFTKARNIKQGDGFMILLVTCKLHATYCFVLGAGGSVDGLNIGFNVNRYIHQAC